MLQGLDPGTKTSENTGLFPMSACIDEPSAAAASGSADKFDIRRLQFGTLGIGMPG